MRLLVHTIKKSNKGPHGFPPKIMIIAPQPISKLTNAANQFDENSVMKSKALPELYKKIAERRRMWVF